MCALLEFQRCVIYWCGREIERRGVIGVCRREVERGRVRCGRETERGRDHRGVAVICGAEQGRPPRCRVLFRG